MHNKRGGAVHPLVIRIAGYTIISVICNSSLVHTIKLPGENTNIDEYGSCLLNGSPTSQHMLGNCKNQGSAKYEIKFKPMNRDVRYDRYKM